MRGALRAAIVISLALCGPAEADDAHHRSADLERLADRIAPQTPLGVQLAAVEEISGVPGEEARIWLLSNWEQQGPRVHQAVVAALLQREPWIGALQADAETRPELAASLDWARRDLWIRHPSADVRMKAGNLLRQRVPPPKIREAVVRFRPVLRRSGDTSRGRAVFDEATCANCHKLNEVGRHVGPDLARLIDRSPRTLLLDTVDPNRLLNHAYVDYTLITSQGQPLAGMLYEESGADITLADADGKLQTLKRSDIDELVSNRRSHMPEGLEARLTLQQMADLLAFITAARPSETTPDNANEELSLRPRDVD